MVFVCCVVGCDNSNKQSIMHRFPVNKETICKIWLDRIGNPKLKNMDKKALYYNYRICEDHFYQGTIQHWTRRRLRDIALPIYNLPSFNGEPTVENSVYAGTIESKTVICVNKTEADNVLTLKQEIKEEWEPYDHKYGITEEIYIKEEPDPDDHNYCMFEDSNILREGNLKLSPPSPKKVCYSPSFNAPFENEPARDERLIPTTERPFNGGPKASLLLENYCTSNEIFYIRNHLPVPIVTASDFKLTVDVEGGSSKTFSLDEIKQLPTKTVTITAQCGGLRRQEMTDKLKKDTQGVKWEINGVSNATWTGVNLIDVLKLAGYNESTHADLEHLQFTSAYSPGGPYVTGIPIHRVLNPKNNVMLCWEMNGQELTPDHGYPLRVIVPGVIGARWVKQIEKIEVQKEECQAHWHQQLYKYFGPHVTLENVDYSSISPVQELPVMSAILSPSDQETVTISGGKLPIKGFAYSGGGNKIVRVEVSNNKGKSWMPAKFDHCGSDPVPYHFTWTLWSCDVPTDGKKCIEIWVKATDSACNVQPETWDHIYNIRGVACNAFHKIKVNVK